MTDESKSTSDQHDFREYDPEARARALQSLLTEKQLLSADAVDDIIAKYEEEIGPLIGATVVARLFFSAMTAGSISRGIEHLHAREIGERPDIGRAASELGPIAQPEDRVV